MSLKKIEKKKFTRSKIAELPETFLEGLFSGWFILNPDNFIG
jgi:hypothetical protein